MSSKARRYRGEQIDVTYDLKRCIHAAECVRGLPAVFNTAERPWIQPAKGTPEAVAEVVMRCPTGALQIEQKEGGSPEPIPQENRIVLTPDGPLYLRGDLTLEVDEARVHETRVALCRCGQSANKPFCDNTHRKVGFTHDGQMEAAPPTEQPLSGPLTITPTPRGPLRLSGNFEVVGADGRCLYRGTKAALCRCGGSANKPFCDGSHKGNHFGEESES